MLALCLDTADVFVCADGAARNGIPFPRKPDLVIGDFDSLGDPPSLDPGVRALKIFDQSRSDAEKALGWILAEGYAEALLLGATGRRLDHSVFNVQLLERFAARLRLGLADAHALTLRLSPNTRSSWSLPPGTLFSLLPHAGAAHGVSLQGARYPLQGATIDCARLNTLSNRVEQSPLVVGLGTGVLLLSIAWREDADALDAAAP